MVPRPGDGRGLALARRPVRVFMLHFCAYRTSRCSLYLVCVILNLAFPTGDHDVAVIGDKKYGWTAGRGIMRDRLLSWFPGNQLYVHTFYHLIDSVEATIGRFFAVKVRVFAVSLRRVLPCVLVHGSKSGSFVYESWPPYTSPCSHAAAAMAAEGAAARRAAHAVLRPLRLDPGEGDREADPREQDLCGGHLVPLRCASAEPRASELFLALALLAASGGLTRRRVLVSCVVPICVCLEASCSMTCRG